MDADEVFYGFLIWLVSVTAAAIFSLLIGQAMTSTSHTYNAVCTAKGGRAYTTNQVKDGYKSVCIAPNGQFIPVAE